MARKRGAAVAGQPTKPQPSGVKCCACRNPVDSTGWCSACNHYPGNVSPRRVGTCGHTVDASGWCHTDRDFRASRLEFTDGHWVDTSRTDRALSKSENKARMQFLMEAIGKGDRAAIVKFAKARAKAEPGIGWEQAVAELEGAESDVPF